MYCKVMKQLRREALTGIKVLSQHLVNLVCGQRNTIYFTRFKECPETPEHIQRQIFQLCKQPFAGFIIVLGGTVPMYRLPGIQGT